MSDTLDIFGTQYSNVTGIRAYDPNNVLKTYIRPEGAKTITTPGTGIDVAHYATVNVTDSNLIPANIVDGVTIFGVTGTYTGAVIDETPDGNGGTITTITTGINALKTQGKIGITPLTTSQTIIPDSGYDALSSVQIDAMPSGFVGSPVATKGEVVNHHVVIVPAVAYRTGYIEGDVKTGTSVTVDVTELESGTKSITENGTGISVSGYSTVDVNVASQSTDFWVTLTYSSSTDMWTPDCTIADVQTAYNANKAIRTYAYDTNGGYEWPSVCEYDSGSNALTYSVLYSVQYQSGLDCRRQQVYILDSSGVTSDDYTDYVYASGLQSKTITSNGTYNAVDESPYPLYGYSSVIVNVASAPSLQAKTNITPTESSQTITPDSGYNGLSSVQINAISSTYVGSGITQRSSTDLTASGATVTVPAGYYSAQASKSVTTMTLPTSATSSATSGYTSKATIGRSTSAQYINIPPGYNSSGGYYTISATPNGTVTAPSSISGTSASITTGTNTITLTKTVSITPNVSTAGYISSGTAGNSSVSLTASVTVNPTPTASGATVTIPAGYYSTQTTKSVSSGSATGPSTVSGTSATITTGTNTITLTKTNVTTTPTVSAGYVSAATASTATVTLTASVTTKAAATITPGTSNQTIASGTYLTGTQTIAGDADLVASNIISTANIFGVQGSVVINKYYTGSSAPTSSLGNNGDIYLQE